MSVKPCCTVDLMTMVWHRGEVSLKTAGLRATRPAASSPVDAADVRPP